MKQLWTSTMLADQTASNQSCKQPYKRSCLNGLSKSQTFYCTTWHCSFDVQGSWEKWDAWIGSLRWHQTLFAVCCFTWRELASTSCCISLTHISKTLLCKRCLMIWTFVVAFVILIQTRPSIGRKNFEILHSAISQRCSLWGNLRQKDQQLCWQLMCSTINSVSRTRCVS